MHFQTTDYLQSTCVDLCWVTKQLELSQIQRKSVQIGVRANGCPTEVQVEHKLKLELTFDSIWLGA